MLSPGFSNIKSGLFLMVCMSSLIKKINTLTCTEPKFGFGPKAKKFSNSIVKIEKKPVSIKITGNLFMLPKRDESEFGIKYSLCVEFSMDDCALLDAILDKLEIEDWERKECHNEGSIFLNLKPNGAHTEFKFKNNVGLKPLKLYNDKFDVGMDVTVDMLVAGWYMQDTIDDVEVKKFGLSLKVKDIWFGPLPSKRRRKDEEEVRERS